MKQAGLMYCMFPWRPPEGSIRAQPGITSGMAIGSELSCPIESPPLMLSKGHIGVPSLSSRTPPNPQPLAIHPTGPESDAGVGICHKPLMTRLRVTLKSEGPLIMLASQYGMVGVTLF